MAYGANFPSFFKLIYLIKLFKNSQRVANFTTSQFENDMNLNKLG